MRDPEYQITELRSKLNSIMALLRSRKELWQHTNTSSGFVLAEEYEDLLEVIEKMS